MPRASQINGVPVICLLDGSRLGKVKQIVVDSKQAAVVSFGVEGPYWWRPCRIVEIADVAGLSDEVLVVATAQTLRIVEERPQLEELLLSESDLVGRPVLASTGKFMGRVKDFFFDYPSGSIEMVTIQPNGDPDVVLQLGAERISVVGRDAVIVRDTATAAVPQETPAKVVAPPTVVPAEPVVAPAARPAVAPAAQPVPSAPATSAAPAVPVASATPAVPAPPAMPTTGADLARLFRERQERFLLGKTAQRAVRDDQAAILVDADEVVDQEKLDKVKAAGKLLELTASVSMRR